MELSLTDILMKRIFDDASVSGLEFHKLLEVCSSLFEYSIDQVHCDIIVTSNQTLIHFKARVSTRARLS